MATKLSSPSLRRPSAPLLSRTPSFSAHAGRVFSPTSRDVYARTDLPFERRPSLGTATAGRPSPPPPVIATPETSPAPAPVAPVEFVPLPSVRAGLRMTDREGADCFERLQRAGVTHALLCSGDMRTPFAEHIAYRRLGGLYDDAQSPLQFHLPGALSWMRDVLAQDGQLVLACRTGDSCSAAVMCAYLMWSEELTYDVALSEVRRAWPNAAPNAGFQEQLESSHWRLGLPPRLPPKPSAA